MTNLAWRAGEPPLPPTTDQPVFDPMIFFAGRTHGDGTLEMRFGADRSIRVEGHGWTRPDGTFQLDQTITFGDGAVESRDWRLSRLDANRFSATLSDARGKVTARASGNLFHLRYLIRRPAVWMEQWLYLQPDGQSVLNLARVTVLGVPSARLSETITRVDQ